MTPVDFHSLIPLDLKFILIHRSLIKLHEPQREWDNGGIKVIGSYSNWQPAESLTFLERDSTS